MTTTTRTLLLTLLSLALATPAVRAGDDLPFEWAGAWHTDSGATRAVERVGNATSLAWTGADGAAVRLHGAGNSATLALSGRRPGAVGISEKLQGEQVGPRADTPVRLVATRAADDAEGRWVADVQVTDGKSSTRERWTRTGPTRLEIVSCSEEDGWNPKSKPLTLQYRLRGSAARLRLRVLATAPAARDLGNRVVSRRQAAYEALATRDGDALVVHEAVLGGDQPVKAGTHEVTWDGRDDTKAKRLVHGGRLLLVVEALDAPGVERAERPLEVAAPVTRLVAPNWPKSPVNPATPHMPRDMGRDRAKVHQEVQDGARGLGFSGPGAHEAAVTSGGFMEALQTSAVVFVATHGGERSIALYTSAKDDELDAAHMDEVEAYEVEQLGTALRQERPGSATKKRFEDDATPLRDLHTVVIWACLAGTKDLPEALLARGCDNVVGFSSWIDGGGVDPFFERLLEGLLTGDPRSPAADRQPLTVSEASRVAAAHATQLVWDETRKALERRQRKANADHQGQAGWVPFLPTAPYTDCLVTYTAKGASGADTHLEVARWGNSTNTGGFDRATAPETEFTRSTTAAATPSPTPPAPPAATDSPRPSK